MNAKELKAFCMSDSCCRQNNIRAPKKEKSVRQGSMECPDCRSILIWRRGRVMNRVRGRMARDTEKMNFN